MAKQINISIFQGKTFIHVVRWEQPTLTYKAITAITRGAPVQITAPAHGLPSGWRSAVASVQGMEEINAANTPPKRADMHQVIVTDPNTVLMPDVNSADFAPYTSGGYLVFKAPVDLAGYTARMSIKDRVGGTLITPQMTTENGKIVIDNVAKTITLILDAAATASITKTDGVYDLELVSAGGVVTPLMYGDVTIQQEVTT
jgi:hypothetical protein